MAKNSLSRALEFYDMGLAPERGVEHIEDFLEECAKKMYIIEKLYEDPAGYIRKRYGIRSDVDLVDENTSSKSYEIFDKNFGFRPAHPILTAKGGFLPLSYSLVPANLVARATMVLLYTVNPYSGTILRVGDNDTTVSVPLLKKGKIDKDPGAGAHELFHSVREEWERKSRLRMLYLPWLLETLYDTAEEEYVAYGLMGSRHLSPRNYALGWGLSSLLTVVPVFALLEFARNPSLISNPLNMASIIIKYPIMAVTFLGSLEYGVCKYVETFRKNAEGEGLNSGFILTKANAFELGITNIRENIKTKEGLRWDLLRAKLDISPEESSQSRQ